VVSHQGLSHQGLVQDAADYAVVRMVGATAVAPPAAAMIQVLANLHDYRQPVVAIAVWVAMFPAAIWLVPRMRTDRFAKGEAMAAMLIAIAAVAVIGWDHDTQHAAGRVDLAVLGTAWLLALLALTSAAWVWVPGAVAVFAVHAALLIRMQGAGQLTLAQLEAAGYVIVTVLLAFAALRPATAMHASMSARRAWLASKSVAEHTAAQAVQRDRQDRLALLEMEALPLLRAIADGTLNPADDYVRERCARHAAALRRSLIDRGRPADGLLSGLEPALKAAAARGLELDRRVIGDPGVPSPVIVRAALAAVDALINVLPPQQVLLTVLASDADVELYLTYDEPSPDVPDVARFGQGVPAAAQWGASVTTEETGAGYLRLGWRRGGAA
jgi:hypothetical protein